ncbi:unnamed protein product [Arabidopsis thaliana]|uniref:F-box domain-containing protein n=1 Tax=Arabidopsis thaliana TaxID=3702 RepID=A0A654EYT2_ARATH|nr:unnamed protein product [Arabidopsis thaliana]
MVVLSEIPGDPNEDNQNENPQEEVENLPILLQLPEELIASIVALIPRCHYPSLSLVSRAFRHLITSQELYVARSNLGFTEPVLYALIGFQAYTPPSWFILRRSNFPLQLHRIRSLPPMLSGAAVVTIDYKMYVMGGCIGYNHPASSNVIVIDCRFHTWKYLPDMKRARCRAAAGVIDGRIYVIGGCKKQDADWVEGRLFILDLDCCFAYEPVQGLWESWDDGSELMRFWHSSSSCVVGDLLYALDLTCALEHPIVVYYPNELVWRPVMGVDTAHLPILTEYTSTLANFDGKLVILGGGDCSESSSEIWCVEIALETRQGDQIWGVVKSVSIVSRDLPMRHVIELCRTVMV